MGFKLNLTNDEVKQAQGGGFPALPAGTYGAVIFENVQKKSKAGNEMFEVNYKIQEGPAGKNRKIKSWYVLSGKGLFKIVELHKALGGAEGGFPIPDKGGEYEFPDADEYLSNKVNIVLGVEDYATNDDDPKTGEPILAQRNVVVRVKPYDPDTITTQEDLEAEDDSADGGLFL